MGITSDYDSDSEVLRAGVFIINDLTRSRIRNATYNFKYTYTDVLQVDGAPDLTGSWLQTANNNMEKFMG